MQLITSETLDSDDFEQANADASLQTETPRVTVELHDHGSVKHPKLPPPPKDFVESRRGQTPRHSPRLGTLAEERNGAGKSVKEMRSLWEVRVLGDDSSRDSGGLPLPEKLPGYSQPSDPFLGPPADALPPPRSGVLRLMKSASSGFVEGLRLPQAEQASVRDDDAAGGGGVAANKPAESLRLFHANPEPVLSRVASTTPRRRSSLLPNMLPFSPKGGAGGGAAAPPPESANATWGKALEDRRNLPSLRTSIALMQTAKAVVGRMKALVEENVFRCTVPFASGFGALDLQLQSAGQHTMVLGAAASLREVLPAAALAAVAAVAVGGEEDGGGGEETTTMALPAMTTNLYLYPKVTVEGEASMRSLTPPEQEGFAQLLLLLLLGDGEACALFQRCDAVGAAPLHALLVANTPPALELAMRLIWAQPTLLLQVHAAWGPFDGESVLHVLAANRQEGLLVDGLPARAIPGVLEIARAKLSEAQHAQLWRSLARGPFFTAVPMRHFGGSAIGYLSCFGMKRALLQLFASAEATGGLSLNDAAQACAITGYLPLHAVTACGMRDTTLKTRRRSLRPDPPPGGTLSGRFRPKAAPGFGHPRPISRWSPSCSAKWALFST